MAYSNTIQNLRPFVWRWICTGLTKLTFVHPFGVRLIAIEGTLMYTWWSWCTFSTIIPFLLTFSIFSHLFYSDLSHILPILFSFFHNFRSFPALLWLPLLFFHIHLPFPLPTFSCTSLLLSTNFLTILTILAQQRIRSSAIHVFLAIFKFNGTPFHGWNVTESESTTIVSRTETLNTSQQKKQPQNIVWHCYGSLCWIVSFPTECSVRAIASSCAPLDFSHSLAVCLSFQMNMSIFIVSTVSRSISTWMFPEWEQWRVETESVEIHNKNIHSSLCPPLRRRGFKYGKVIAQLALVNTLCATLVYGTDAFIRLALFRSFQHCIRICTSNVSHE